MRLTIKSATILLVATIFSTIVSCSKSSSSFPQINPVNPSGNSDPQIDPTGNYQGTLTIYLDGKFLESQNNAQAIIVLSTIKGKYSIMTSSFLTLNATISNGSITIPNTVTNSGTVSLKEFGNGKINGNTLTFDITQELSANGQISSTLRYTFNGVKK